MRERIANEAEEINLGRVGENKATRITFELAKFFPSFSLSVVKLFRKGGEITTQRENDKLYWIVTNADTAKAGTEEVELVLYDGDTVAKSVTFHTRVNE